jgi:uncharacterized protein with HEPN domain
MRADAEWLEDILEAIGAIERYRPATRADFDANEPIQSHLLRQLQIIGEAMARVSETVKAAHPQIPWRQTAGMRNVIVHAYFQIDWNEVWNTIETDIPSLKPKIQSLWAALRARP